MRKWSATNLSSNTIRERSKDMTVAGGKPSKQRFIRQAMLCKMKTQLQYYLLLQVGAERTAPTRALFNIHVHVSNLHSSRLCLSLECEDLRGLRPPGHQINRPTSTSSSPNDGRNSSTFRERATKR